MAGSHNATAPNHTITLDNVVGCGILSWVLTGDENRHTVM